MHIYQGKNVKFMRKAEPSDPGFDTSKDQLWITLEDGTSKMVLANEVVLQAEPQSPQTPVVPPASMGTYQGRNIKALRPATSTDSGYDPTVPQSFITFDDGKTIVVPANTVIHPPFNPAQPTHQPIRTGTANQIETLNRVIDELVLMRNRMTGNV